MRGDTPGEGGGEGAGAERDEPNQKPLSGFREKQAAVHQAETRFGKKKGSANRDSRMNRVQQSPRTAQSSLAAGFYVHSTAIGHQMHYLHESVVLSTHIYTT